MGTSRSSKDLAHKLSKSKARKMLHEVVVRGRKVTPKQRGYFGAVASGKSYK